MQVSSWLQPRPPGWSSHAVAEGRTFRRSEDEAQGIVAPLRCRIRSHSNTHVELKCLVSAPCLQQNLFNVRRQSSNVACPEVPKLCFLLCSSGFSRAEQYEIHLDSLLTDPTKMCFHKMRLGLQFVRGTSPMADTRLPSTRCCISGSIRGYCFASRSASCKLHDMTLA